MNKTGEKVLVIGLGSTAKDIIRQLNQTAIDVTCSQIQYKNIAWESIKFKGAVERFTSNGAEFADGTTENFTVVIFATG